MKILEEVKKLKPINIRGLSSEIYQKLKLLSERNNRSLEGEARTAIIEWVMKADLSMGAIGRCRATGERLSHLLALYNFGESRTLNVAALAQIMERESASEFEDYFAGYTEPNFSLLDEISDFFGCSTKWLSTGLGSPYKVEYSNIPADTEQFLKWATTINDEPVDTIHFVRSDDPRGRLIIVKKWHFTASDDSIIYHYQIITCDLNLSSSNGTSGYFALSHFARNLEALFKADIPGRDTSTIRSHIVSDVVFKALEAGFINPNQALKNSYEPWWQDIWDEQLNKNNKYWADWDKMIVNIANARNGEVLIY